MRPGLAAAVASCAVRLGWRLIIPRKPVAAVIAPVPRPVIAPVPIRVVMRAIIVRAVALVPIGTPVALGSSALGDCNASEESNGCQRPCDELHL